MSPSSQCGTTEPGTTRLTRTAAREQIIEAKREHREPAEASEPEAEPSQVLDLMAALNESVARARHSRGEGKGEAVVHEMRPPKKTAKKQTAGKAGKKPSGRRPRSA
ncbi:hypothetical protein [Streptomyces sp. NPDC056160]|uniref:hypothetical protein n=1 Tax=Streptomyces sp. NPDC056160 TaxID=3345731 RepID=UPI0035DCC04B